MTAHFLRTATDFRQVLAYHDFAVWNLTHYGPDLEPTVRSYLDNIFADLKYLEAGDTEMMSCYLEDVTEPLEQLWKLGCAIMAVVSRGTMRLSGQGEIENWVRTHFFVVPIHGSFRIGDDLTSPIHRFNPNCSDAISALHHAVRDGLAVSSWADDRSVTVDYEGRVPWCSQCLVESLGARRDG